MGALFCCCKRHTGEDAKDEKDKDKEEKAPPGSWLQHVDKDEKNNSILWLNNHTKVRSYRLFYLPWDSSSALPDQLKNAKEATPVKMDGDPKKIPAGSWLQHVRDDDTYCWRNHSTGVYAKSIYYLKSEVPPSLSVAPENLLKADFVVVFEKKSDGKKKDSAKPSKAGKPKAGSAPPKATSIPFSPWEERYNDTKTGKPEKYWHNRDTGETTSKDPFK